MAGWLRVRNGLIGNVLATALAALLGRGNPSRGSVLSRCVRVFMSSSRAHCFRHLPLLRVPRSFWRTLLFQDPSNFGGTVAVPNMLPPLASLTDADLGLLVVDDEGAGGQDSVAGEDSAARRGSSADFRRSLAMVELWNGHLFRPLDLFACTRTFTAKRIPRTPRRGGRGEGRAALKYDHT